MDGKQVKDIRLTACGGNWLTREISPSGAPGPSVWDDISICRDVAVDDTGLANLGLQGNLRTSTDLMTALQIKDSSSGASFGDVKVREIPT